MFSRCIVQYGHDGLKPIAIPEWGDFVANVAHFRCIVAAHADLGAYCVVEQACRMRNTLLVLITRQMKSCRNLVTAVPNRCPRVWTQAQFSTRAGVTGTR
uniref:Uncharacterized protein n=1 Tax=Cacopsylla melanoneura TaxID=428564 RepID=A0A8D8LEL2_9HEMI